MLIRNDPQSPFDTPCTQRLIALENVLRQHSDSSITISQYQKVLEQAAINVPTTRTLQEDLRRYGRYCDDVVYGDNAKKLRLDPDATRDAVIWLLGVPWLESPLRPRLSSACVRCLLLAKELKAEVAINYSALRKEGKPWVPQEIVGIPIRPIPGADAGYFQLHIAASDPRKIINLSRIQRFVSFTGQATDGYVALTPEPQFVFTLEISEPSLLNRLVAQFAGLKKENKNRAVMHVEKSLRRMTIDMLKSHLQRTKSDKRQVQATTLKINDNVSIQIEQV
ncbi:hypothetical protein PN36_23345 [Candidatus Thiomargarita nelsonii]|uniref:Uncharacterized protein n=1 Tax=Candidatus Thiomargarita nelsonii TaxID=1003181 RepID=A0A4E0QN47_9GAMM|nr:hypothetical protein PN36_23345 [Candidatus Thiomargarita nelsonii]